MSEKISALIDNELDELERVRVLKELGRSDGMAEVWSRYHLIGLAMRREAVSIGGNLPERISETLQSEPPAGSGTARRFSNLLQPGSRLALAASIAGILVLGGVVLEVYKDTRGGGAAPPAGQEIANAADGTRWEGTADPRAEDALNALLVEHGEFTSASGMNGLTAYTKFVAYDSPR